MTKIKKEILNINKFNSMLKMFRSSLDEDFFLALNMWGQHDKTRTLNTIMARRISKNCNNHWSERELHKRLLEFTTVYNTFNLDTTFSKLIDLFIADIVYNEELHTILIKEEILTTVTTLLDYHGIADKIKITKTNIKL